MTGIHRLEGDFLPDQVRVLAFSGQEQLNRPYLFTIVFSLLGEDALAFDLDAAIGERAAFFLSEGAHAVHPAVAYHGNVASLELLDDLEEVSLFRIQLVPRLWGLGLGEHSRVFVDQTLPEILREVLEDGGLTLSDFELRLTGSYPKLSHVCQYRESRLTFITRWLERVGARYYFEQGEEREMLVIADGQRHEPSLAEPVPFFPDGEEDVSAGEAFRTFSARYSVQPRKVTVRDYASVHPRLDVAGHAEAAPYEGGREVRLFNVKEHSPERALAYGKVVAQGFATQAVNYRASGRVTGLIPGFTFELDDHPRVEWIQEYLVTAVSHQGWDPAAADLDADIETLLGEPIPTLAPTADSLFEEGFDGIQSGRDAYRCVVTAVAAEQGWVSQRTVPWPRIRGTVRAWVDGPATSEYAQLDEHGRYLVRLLFDESGLPDGKASERVRLLQPHAGDLEQHHFPLRKGTEVQVAFLRGDPDQPVIAGVTPNAVHPSPVVQSNHTQNVVQTGSRVRLEIEDQAGSQYIDLSCPTKNVFAHLGAHAGLGTHNAVLSTDGDYLMHTGGDRDILVEGDQTETVAGDVNESYHANQTTTVEGALTEIMDGGSTQTIHSGFRQTVDGGVTQQISGGETRRVSGGQTETLSGGRNQAITGSSAETIHGSLSQTITGGAYISTPADYAVQAAEGFSLTTPAAVEIVAPGGFNLLAPGGQTRIDNTFVQLGEKLADIVGSKTTAIGGREDAIGVYADVSGVKIDAFGVKWTSAIQAESWAAISVGSHGVATDVGTLRKLYSGLVSLGG